MQKGRVRLRQHRVVMLLSNAFRPDPRVLKEARSLANAGYTVTVLAWDREGRYPAQETIEGFTVQRVQDVRSSYGAGLRQAWRLPRFWWQAWRRLDRLQPDVVHCHDFDTLPSGWLWAKLHRRPVIYDAHEYYTELQRPRLRGPLGKVLLALIAGAEQALSRSTAAVITVDERLASRYRHRRVAVIGHYPPVEFGRGSSPSPDLSLGGRGEEAPSPGLSRRGGREEAPSPGLSPGGRGEEAPSPGLSCGGRGEDAPSPALSSGERGEEAPSPGLSRRGGGKEAVLVYAGRFSTDRGMVVLAQALQRLAARGLRPRLRLLGAWTSPSEEQAFWQAIAGLAEQVDLVGWVPFEEVPAQLAAADVALAVLQPIERYVAALPVKLFEYMACGLPVVISDFPANRAVVAGADCGILVDPTDADAVAAAIARLLTDPDEARRLGANGRHAFATQYNWQALEPSLLGLYAQLSAPH